MELLAPDHLRQDICSPYRHQPYHRPIRIFSWMDSYAVLAAALLIIPSLWRQLNFLLKVTAISWIKNNKTITKQNKELSSKIQQSRIKSNTNY